MILRVDNFLASEQVERFRESLKGVHFVDGRRSAGRWAEQLKRNAHADPPGVESLGGEIAERIF